MSAERWTICPKCRNGQRTLAHYYGIGVNEEGEFIVDYGCRCDECGFEFIYGYNQTCKINDRKPISALTLNLEREVIEVLPRPGAVFRERETGITFYTLEGIFITKEEYDIVSKVLICYED